MTHAIARFGRVLTAVNRRGARTLLAAVILASGAARADDDAPGSPTFALHGFGTLGAIHSDQNYSDVVSSVYLQPNGAGATSAWSTGVDSKAGVQLDALFSPKLSAVVQVLSQHRHDNSWTPTIEWANVKYQITPELSVRVGRTVSSIFMTSDTANVGYANPWLRGPQEIYGMAPFTHQDGIDLAWNVNIGPATNSVQASFGNNKFDVIGGDKIKVGKMFIASDTLEYGELALRVGYVHTEVTFDSSGLDALIKGLSNFGNALTLSGFPTEGDSARALANGYNMDHTPVEAFTAGFRADPGNWRLMAEWAQISDAGILPKTTGWYITNGYQLRALTPYITIATLDSKTPSESGIPLAGLPPGPLSGAGDALNRGLGVVLDMAAPSQKSLTLGLRWDLLDNAALKFEYEHIRLDDLSGGRFGNPQPGFKPGGDADLFSIALDFVF